MSAVPQRLTFVAITNAAGAVVEPGWLARAETVHRQLREQLPADYVGRMTQIFTAGARMVVAVLDDKVCGIALWRVIENTYEGRRLYVDDLVTDSAQRSTGIGKGLLDYLEHHARTLGCDVLTLDSGTQRTQAHKFYFREGMTIPSFCFRKVLT